MKDVKLDTKTARAKLSKRHPPYWRNITTGLYLGYRKGDRGGVWMGRKLEGRRQYKQWKIGMADDGDLRATGRDIFTYQQAIQKAQLGPVVVTSEVQTVLDAVNYYMTEKEHDFKPTTLYTMRRSVRTYIELRIGKLKLEQLNKEAIRRWRDSVRDEPPRGSGPEPGNSEALRRRSATANRVLTILKAALNFAEEEEKYRGFAPWRLVKPYRNTDAPKPTFLQVDQAIRLLNACPPHFRELVRAGLETGCRYGELIRLEVRDFNREQGSVLIRESKSGKPRTVFLSDDGASYFTNLTLGRKARERLFLRENGEPWGKSNQSRPMLEACQRASIEPPISFKALRTTYGSLLANAGVELHAISEALGHADTRITKKHYAHLREDYLAKQVRENLPSFGKVRRRVLLLRPKTKS